MIYPSFLPSNIILINHGMPSNANWNNSSSTASKSHLHPTSQLSRSSDDAKTCSKRQNCASQVREDLPIINFSLYQTAPHAFYFKIIIIQILKLKYWSNIDKKNYSIWVLNAYKNALIWIMSVNHSIILNRIEMIVKK
jgi:hypothetical protein